MKKTIRFLAFISLLVILFSAIPVSAKTSGYCIEATPAITDATYKYLNDIYIDKYPEFALEYSFGSDRDKNALKKLSDSITLGLSNDKEKVNAIVNWVDKNIEYVSYTSGEAEYFAIDTYYEKKGNCLGIAQLIIHLCRLSNIKAVMCGGTRGNMEEFIKLDSRNIDHAWAMIYHDGNWNLYDPLFSVNGTTDRKFISKWYFTDFIEGVSPYVKEYVDYINNSDCIFYIDGRFVHYVKGIPASEYYNTAAEGGMSVNGAIPYFTKNRYKAIGGGGDGFHYIENPDRRDTMINDECYSDGWITYGTAMYYANPNGTLAGSTMKEYNGECYFLPYGSDAIKYSGSSTDYFFTRGFPTLIKGTEIFVEPLWIDEAVNEEGKVIVWDSETPETVSVSADGRIKALSDGYACVSVCSKDTVDGDTHYMFSFVEFWVASKERTFTPTPIPEIDDTSKVFTDIKANGWYKEYVDYSVAQGIFTGTSKTEFSPSMNITRAQFVQVLANLVGVDTSNRNVTTSFNDVPTKKWYTAAVKWASENKVVNGMGDGKFEPNANVTREQMCVMLVNFAKFKNITLKTIESKENFADDNQISKWAKTAVYTCQQADIVNGKGAGKFDPKGTGTRAEASVMFTKFHKDYMAK